MNSSVTSKLLSLIYFSQVIEVFFRCCFRITGRFMFRSQDELNTSHSSCVFLYLFSSANISPVRFVLHLQDWWCGGKRDTSFPVNKLWLIYLLPPLWLLTMKNRYACKFWSSQKNESRKQADSSEACSNAKVCLLSLWKLWNLLPSRGFVNSERAAISFYVQTPNEVVNRNSVALLWWSN